MPSRATQKVSNLELRMPYLFNFGNFRLKIRKSDCDICNHHPRIYQNAKDCAKNKKSNLELNCLIWVFWVVSLKSIVIFEISILEFVKMKNP